VRPAALHHEVHVIPIEFVSRFLEGQPTGPMEGWMPLSQSPPIIRVLTINSHGTHWWQIIIWGNETLTDQLMVYAFDSKFERNQNDPDVKKVMNYCATLRRNNGENFQASYNTSMKSNRQANDWDCGIFCIENLRALIQGGADVIATRALLTQVKVTVATRAKLIDEIEHHCQEVHHLSNTDTIFPPPPPGFSTLGSSAGHKKTVEEDLTKDENDAPAVLATPAGQDVVRYAASALALSEKR
jgi:hypothetical protein